jgi:hypothetical protein
MRLPLAIGAAWLAVGASAAAAPAQREMPTLPRVMTTQLPVAAHRPVTAGVPVAAEPHWAIDGKIPLWTAPIASAVVPGAGQAMLHQERLLAYLAVEGFVWLQYFKDVRDWHQQRAAYEQLAAQVARSPFMPNPPIGGWDYYERMEHYVESGVYSLSGSMTDVQPETDENTYNGTMWALARSNFWPDPGAPPPTTSPEYQHALQFYESRAVTPEYRWSWRNAQLEQDLYRRRINKANDAVRRSTSDLGIILANHVLSAVDAFTTLQLHAERGPAGDARLEWRIPTPFR